MPVARGLGIGVVSNLEFMLHPNLRKLSFVNADVSTMPMLFVCGNEEVHS